MDPTPNSIDKTIFPTQTNIDILSPSQKEVAVDILAGGMLNITEKKAVSNIIIKAAQAYPKSIDEQLKVIKFHTSILLGKRMQILIMHKAALEGHCFYAASGKYFVAVYNMYQYLIWKVRLLEDEGDMPIQ